MSPWRTKRGTLPKLSTFLSQLKGDPLEKKQIFEKKISQCRKTERGTLWDFKHPICCEISKKLKGDPLERKKIRKKVSQCRKTERGNPLWFFNIHSVAKHQKIEGGKIFIFGKKSHSDEKTVRGDLLRFSNIHSDAKQQKTLKGDPLGKFFSKMSRSAEKK